MCIVVKYNKLFQCGFIKSVCIIMFKYTIRSHIKDDRVRYIKKAGKLPLTAG